MSDRNKKQLKRDVERLIEANEKLGKENDRLTVANYEWERIYKNLRAKYDSEVAVSSNLREELNKTQ